MKIIIAIALTLLFNIAKAGICEKGPENAKRYRAQKDFKESFVNLGQIPVPALFENDNEFIIEDFKVNSNVAVPIEIDLSSAYENLDEFKKICSFDQNKTVKKILWSNKKNPSFNSKFRIKLPFLPKKSEDFFKKQNATFSRSSNISINLQPGSILLEMQEEDSVYVEGSFDFKSHIEILSEKLTKDLQASLESSEDEAQLVLDNQDDLVCDFLTGKANISINLWLNFNSNLQVLDKEVSYEDVHSLHSEYLNEVGPLSQKSRSYFTAALVWKELHSLRKFQTIDSEELAFSIAEGFIEEDLINNKDLQCLAENVSTYETFKSNGALSISLQPELLWGTE